MFAIERRWRVNGGGVVHLATGRCGQWVWAPAAHGKAEGRSSKWGMVAFGEGKWVVVGAVTRQRIIATYQIPPAASHQPRVTFTRCRHGDYYCRASRLPYVFFDNTGYVESAQVEKSLSGRRDMKTPPRQATLFAMPADTPLFTH